MELDPDLWGTLPSELLEQVLSFVPVPPLCRFLNVSKRWNSLMLMPVFGSLCVQYASADACYILGVADYHCEEKTHGWGILDYNAKRWYNVKAQHEYEKGYYCFYDLDKDGGWSRLPSTQGELQIPTSTISNLCGTQ